MRVTFGCSLACPFFPFDSRRAKADIERAEKRSWSLGINSIACRDVVGSRRLLIALRADGPHSAPRHRTPAFDWIQFTTSCSIHATAFAEIW